MPTSLYALAVPTNNRAQDDLVSISSKSTAKTMASNESEEYGTRSSPPTEKFTPGRSDSLPFRTLNRIENSSFRRPPQSRPQNQSPSLLYTSAPQRQASLPVRMLKRTEDDDDFVSTSPLPPRRTTQKDRRTTPIYTSAPRRHTSLPTRILKRTEDDDDFGSAPPPPPRTKTKDQLDHLEDMRKKRQEIEIAQRKLREEEQQLKQQQQREEQRLKQHRRRVRRLNRKKLQNSSNYEGQECTPPDRDDDKESQNCHGSRFPVVPLNKSHRLNLSAESMLSLGLTSIVECDEEKESSQRNICFDDSEETGTFSCLRNDMKKIPNGFKPSKPETRTVLVSQH
mmetsp:Transcript_18323/g.27687  ORF Transcript_18323/g.27687 Transcript_18323/m.27687 type:complete len:339 (+) Transcript_18323:70-1086(+)|eukprot:CAMPEP_0178915282 /NCGR_PEP_ID=MMETSP0786-20121207/11936_1 /TAXON_ID=186022 /ORGANISM="Thalassionema frauenfeldii, Strain CCMP 1798" /LENGTH=338 /DNA_ID=CAMNT_0020588367 /DNA_START=59 /DNA_END=1075 /DNA_ORIENTATION=+